MPEQSAVCPERNEFGRNLFGTPCSKCCMFEASRIRSVTRSTSRVSSAVEQRFCKPLVGSSILSPGTTSPRVQNGNQRRSATHAVWPRPRRRRVAPSRRLDPALPAHSVLCSAPHSLQVYETRVSPGDAVTRFGAPHLPHLVSIRVLPCLMVTVFRSKASFTRRSASSRIACFDISAAFFLVRSMLLHAIADFGNDFANSPVSPGSPPRYRAGI